MKIVLAVVLILCFLASAISFATTGASKVAVKKVPAKKAETTIVSVIMEMIMLDLSILHRLASQNLLLGSRRKVACPKKVLSWC